MQNLEVNYLHDELDYVEGNVLYSAELFLNGVRDWNEDHVVHRVCEAVGYDPEFVWLASRVLFEDAVRYMMARGRDGEFS